MSTMGKPKYLGSYQDIEKLTNTKFQCCGSCHNDDDYDDQEELPDGSGYYSTCCTSGRVLRIYLKIPYDFDTEDK